MLQKIFKKSGSLCEHIQICKKQFRSNRKGSRQRFGRNELEYPNQNNNNFANNNSNNKIHQGQPYPMQEQAAIECVMNFAIEKLGFPVERVMLYGWSIGGYTATYAASNYSGINSLVTLFKLKTGSKAELGTENYLYK